MTLIPQQPDGDDRGTRFVRLLSQHDQSLQGFIVSLVPNWADAAEIAQDVKMRLWKQFDDYDPSGDFGAWSRTIARFQVLTYRKQQTRERTRMSDRFIELVAAEAELVSTESEVRRDALNRCLLELTPDNRDLLRRCYTGKNSIKDVANQMGRSVRATQASVAKMRQFLQRCIETKLDKGRSP